ncbi:MAG: hypothetical protein EU544_03005 [Promethearchaeota archaeon]|nr:MAG: hypothetical protein EU544_03005 [Candidatus Lokiarchaeota archaeon]
MKPRFLIISLTSCSGCIGSLISLDVFPQFLERTKDIHFPFINDVEEIKDCDVALIEGSVSMESQIDKLKNVRQHAKKVFALGSCAAFGGINSLSKETKVAPISKYIEIDGIIPGCPPPSKLLGNILIQLIEGKEIELPKKNLCANCPLNGDLELDKITTIDKLLPDPEDIALPEENDKCFLKRGILCLGPVVREGCDHRCIKMGLPCEGCMGPVSKDFTSNMVNFLSLLSLDDSLKKYEGVFYRFGKPNLMR